jgi:hypothetical protein
MINARRHQQCITAAALSLLKAPTLMLRVHWQLRTPPLAAQKLNARVKAWEHVDALVPWTASAPLGSAHVEWQPAL